MFVFVCVCCVSVLHLFRVSDFIRFFIRAVFSAVFSFTVLPGVLFVLIDFFLVLLSMANKDSFIHSLSTSSNSSNFQKSWNLSVVQDDLSLLNNNKETGTPIDGSCNQQYTVACLHTHKGVLGTLML